MRKVSALIFSWLLAVVFGSAVLGCGGGSNQGTTPNPIASVSVAPTSLSLVPGQVAAVAARPLDADDNVTFANSITFASANTNLVQVARSGLVCAGTWDSLDSPVVCTPIPDNPGTSQNEALGMTTLTATADTVTSDPVPVFVHLVIDNLAVTPPAVDCVSQDGTQQFGVTVTLRDGTVLTGNQVSSTVGPIMWTSSTTAVATVDANGKATAVVPGKSNISASVGGTTSPAATFTVCPPASISLHVSDGPATSFTITSSGTGNTRDLAVDVVDTLGNPVTGLPVTLVTSTPAVATVATTTSGTTVTRRVTGVTPGTAIITAQCTPPACNLNTTLATYSNPVEVTVTGTVGAGRAFATCTSTSPPCTTTVMNGTQTPLVPIDTSANTAGTPVQLPNTPNSMVFSPDGTTVFLGSAKGLMPVEATSNQVSATITNAPGRALAISQDGNRVAIFDATANQLRILNRSANTVTSFNLTGVTAAAFTPDAFKLFVVAGDKLRVFSDVLAPLEVTLNAAASDLAVVPGGSFLYMAGGALTSVSARATCDTLPDTSQHTVVTTPGDPALIRTLPDGSRVLAVESSRIDDVTVAPTFSGPCPYSLSSAVTSTDFMPSLMARQLIVLPDGSKAYVTSDLTSLLVYDVTNQAVMTIPLANGATAFTGGAIPSSTQLYVGGDDNAVHRIDPAVAPAMGDVQQIPVLNGQTPSVGFIPDLVGVRPR